MQGTRIGIIGSAGTGKSTIAVAIADQMKIPICLSKTITGEILNRDGYDYSSMIQVERFLAQGNRQVEMLNKHIAFEDANDQFVTDRTVIDLLAYTIAESHEDPAKVDFFYKLCKEQSKKYTHLFVCPWVGKLAPNNRRTLNPWYQYMIHSLDCSILNDWNIKFVTLGGDMDVKIQKAIEVIKSL